MTGAGGWRQAAIVVAAAVLLVAGLIVAGRSRPVPSTDGDGAAASAKPETAPAPETGTAPDHPCRDRSRAAGAPIPVQRIVAGAEPVTDSQDATWSPSDGWTGGRTVTASQEATKTGSPDLYRQARVGVEKLHVDVPGPGTYAVEVSAADDAAAHPGERVFDVMANGQTVKAREDIVAAVGAGVPHHVLFTVGVPGHCLDIGFVPIVGETMVSTVAVGYLGPALDGAVTWSDEFDGPAGAPVDAGRWQHETGGGGWGNKELQHYTDDPSSSHLDGQGHLQLVARHSGGPVGSPSARYDSARLITKDRASFRYGRFEIRVRPPIGAGLWPGFWALGDDIDRVGFPASGEIDILEATGVPGWLLGHLHGSDGAGGTFSLGVSFDSGVDGLATYSLLWTPVGIGLSVGDRMYFVGSPSDLAPGAVWPFDKPFYLLLTLSVGGSVPGPPTAATPFPAEMLVDHIRVTTW